MPNVQDLEISQEIKYYLSKSNHPHLESCLDMVPEENQRAIYNMVSAMQFDKIKRDIIARCVADDVAAIVEGNPDAATNCKPFLKED